MMGIHNSLSALLAKDVPGLFVTTCICHSFHLCASYACLHLPTYLEDLVRDIYNHFHFSYKRSSNFKEFQNIANVKPRKILHHSQTRWLSLDIVVSRVLEQYEALKLYFSNAAAREKLVVVKSIDRLTDPVTKLYLEFLDFVHPIFTDLNKEMQSESPKVHLLYQSVERSYRSLLDCCIRRPYLERFSTGIQGISCHLTTFTAALSLRCDLSPERVTEFGKRCLAFYIEGAEQIYKRCQFRKNTTLKNMNAIAPSDVVAKHTPSIAPLAASFPGIVCETKRNDIDREWRLLRNTDLRNAPEDIAGVWSHVREMTTGDGSEAFQEVTTLVRHLLCLPHSSAAVERIFSHTNNMKTKERSSLNVASLTGLLHSKRKIAESSCYEMMIENQQLERFNSQMYETLLKMMREHPLHTCRLPRAS